MIHNIIKNAEYLYKKRNEMPSTGKRNIVHEKKNGKERSKRTEKGEYKRDTDIIQANDQNLSRAFIDNIS